MPVNILEYQFAEELSPLLKETFKSNARYLYFLVPGTGDRRWLRDTLVGEGTFGGGEPTILRWEELYRETAARLHTDKQSPERQIDPPDHWLIVRYILEELLKETSMGKNLPPAIHKAGFISILGSTMRELLREEVLPEDLSKSLECNGCDRGRDCPIDETPDRLLCLLYHRYTAYLESRGLFDSAQAATVIRKMIEKNPEESSSWLRTASFVFTGFLSFTHGQLLLLRCLHDMGANLTVLVPATGLDIHNAIRQLENLIDEIPHRANCRPLQVLEMESGDQRLEIEHLVRNLALWERREGPLHKAAGPFPGWEDLALSVDENRLPLVEEVLKRYRIPYFIDDGPKVASTPLWKAVSRFRELHGRGFPTNETAWFLAEPFLPAKEFPLETALEAAPRGRKEWKDFLGNRYPEGLLVFETLLSFADSIESGGSPAEILEILKNLTTQGDTGIGGWDRTLSELVVPFTGLDEEVRKLSGAIRELEEKTLQMQETEPDIGPAGRHKLSGDRALAFLFAWAEKSTIWQAPKTTESLTVYVGNPPVLAHHRVFAMTGALASAWPGRLGQSPLLPDEKREQLHQDPSLELGAFHLPLLLEVRKQRQALFRRILACGDELTIVSRPRQDSSGRPLQTSPFLAEAKKCEPPWITPIAEEPVKTTMKDVLPDDGQIRIRPVEVRESEEPLVPERLLREIPLLGERNPMVPTSAYLGDIDLWESCPFRYYAERVLGLKERRPGVFDPAKAGNAIHALWNSAWKERKRTGDPLEKLVPRMWQKEVTGIYPELFGEKSPLKRHRKRLYDQTLRLAKVQDDIDSGGLEKSRKDQILEGKLQTTIEGVTFTGRFDRLDILDSGAVLLDYKSGSSSTYAKSLQLPAYALAMRGKGFPPLLGWSYLCLGDGKVSGRFTEPASQFFGKNKVSLETLDSLIKEAGTKLEAMAKGLLSGNFKPNWDSDACKTCVYRGLCRKDERPGGSGDETNQ